MEAYKTFNMNSNKKGISKDARKILTYSIYALTEKENQDDLECAVKVPFDELYTVLNSEKNTSDTDECEELDSEYLQALNRNRLESVFKELMNYSLKVYEGPIVKHITAIIGIEYAKEVKIIFNPTFVKTYRDQNEKSICLRLSQIEKIKNYNVLCVVEYLLSKKSEFLGTDTKMFKVSPDEFRSIAELDDSNYKRYGDLKKRILMPGLDSIKDLGHEVKMKEHLNGKKVEYIEFEL